MSEETKAGADTPAAPETKALRDKAWLAYFKMCDGARKSTAAYGGKDAFQAGWEAALSASAPAAPPEDALEPDEICEGDIRRNDPRSHSAAIRRRPARQDKK